MAPQEFQTTSKKSASSAEASLPRAGQRYETLTELRADLSEIRNSVERKTGWEVDIDRVQFAVAPPHQMSRRAAVDDTRRTMVPSGQSTSWLGETLSGVYASVYNRSVIALYLPKEGAVLINESLLKSASQDAVKSALHHELTHVAQHQRHPRFFEGLDAEIQRYRACSKHGDDFPKDERDRQASLSLIRVHARTSLLEAQSAVLQEVFEREGNLVPEVRIDLGHVIVGLTHRHLAGMHSSLGHYAASRETFRRIYSERPAEVNTLFTQPEITDRVFGPSNPRGLTLS